MNILLTLIFLLVAALILGSSIMAVAARNIVHAALWLIASFFGVGALYLLLEAEFVAVVQVLIYAGAISILILFAIMLTRHIDDEAAAQPVPLRFWGALVVAGALFGLLIVPTVFTADWQLVPTDQPALSTAVELGQAFMREYLLPFEVASVLLLVALVGAIVIAFEERRRRRRVLTLAEEVALKRAQGSGVGDQGSGNGRQGSGVRSQESEVDAVQASDA